jgi:hypothetical protein
VLTAWFVVLCFSTATVRLRIGYKVQSAVPTWVYVSPPTLVFAQKKLNDQMILYTERHSVTPGCDRWTRFLDNLEKNGLVTELYR